ncbi:hypothetical protein M8J77_013763 [Diaphorina citri]|nr:hypothetical protein M8J77_013763 [Diaphorina citri]
MQDCGCLGDDYDKEIKLTNRELVLRRHAEQREKRSSEITDVHRELIDMIAWKFNMTNEDAVENILDTPDGVDVMTNFLSEGGELAIVIVLQDGPDLKLSCGRSPPFPDPATHKRIFILLPKDLKFFGLDCILCYRTSNEFEPDVTNFAERYNYLFPRCREDIVNFVQDQLLAFNLLLNDVDFASQVPAHLPINSKKYLTTLQDHIATNVKSLTEVSEDFPNTVVFPTVFHVDESGDQGNSSDLSQPLTKCRKEKRVRNVVATVRLWISILSERYENEVKQIAGLDTCGDSVRNEICCWLRLKNSYERIVLPLQDEYMYLTVQEVKTVDTELYEEWEGLTSAITEEYNSLVEEFEYYTLLHKLLTAFEEVPFDSVKYLMVPLIEDIKAYCERQEMENVFGEIVRIARVIDFQEIFVNYFFPDRSAVLWDEDRSLIEEKMKKSVGFLDDILQSIVEVYEEEENPSGEEIKALAEFQAFMDKKKTCFTLIPFIFNMNESIRKKQKLRNRIDQVDFTNNVEWETVITETIRKANDILKETESQMRNLSPELLFDEDRCLRHVEKFVDMINQSDETILGVVEIQVLGTQAITPAMYYLEAFREMFDLKEPKYETINQHMLRLFISEFESLEKYFLMNRERPVDMPRDKPVTLAKMEWAEQLIKKVNELIDMFKTLPLFTKDLNRVRYLSLVPAMKTYQDQCFMEWQKNASEQLVHIMRGPILAKRRSRYEVVYTSLLSDIIFHVEQFERMGYKTSCESFLWTLNMKSMLDMLRDRAEIVNTKSQLVTAMIPPYFRDFIQPKIDRIDILLKEACISYKWELDYNRVLSVLSEVAVFWHNSEIFWSEIIRIKSLLIDEPLEEISRVKLGYVPSKGITIEEWVVANRLFDRDIVVEKLQTMSAKVIKALPIIIKRLIDQYDGIYPGEEKYNYLTADLSQERPCMDKKGKVLGSRLSLGLPFFFQFLDK